MTSAAERTSRWVGGGRKNRRKGERGGRFKKSKGGTAAIAASENGGLLSDPEVDTGNSTAIPHQQSLSRSLGASKSARAPKAEAHPITSCKCMSGGPGNGHYGNTVMDSVFPGSPEKIYNLMFTSGFMRDFLQTDMKLTGEWEYRAEIHDFGLKNNFSVSLQICKYRNGRHRSRARTS